MRKIPQGLLDAVPARLGVVWQSLNGAFDVRHNADARFPAASVIKVPILLELHNRAAQNGLSLDEKVVLQPHHKVGGAGVLLELHDGLELTLDDLGRLMTVVSDNTASNLLIDRLGMDAVNRWMKNEGLQDSHLGRRFMETPSKDRDNWMTPADAALCMQAARKLAAALEILKRQQYREKIPLLLPCDTVVAHKTGELEGVRHDAALVEGPHPYVLVLFTAEGGDPWQVDRALAELSLWCWNQAKVL